MLQGVMPRNALPQLPRQSLPHHPGEPAKDVMATLVKG